MIIKSCVLFVASLTGAGFVTEECYIGEDKEVLQEPSKVYIVKEIEELPSGNIYYEVEEPYVTYWTWPSIRIVYRSYPSYRISWGPSPRRATRVIQRGTVYRSRGPIVRRPVRPVLRRSRTVNRTVRSTTRRPARTVRSQSTRTRRVSRRAATSRAGTASRSRVRRQTKRTPQRRTNVSRTSRRSR